MVKSTEKRRPIKAPKKETRIEKIIKILVKLVTSGGLDKYGRLVINQKPAPGLKIERLISLAMKKMKFELGIETFVDALHRAGIRPNMIENIEMRKLLGRKHRMDVNKLSDKFTKLTLSSSHKQGNTLIEPVAHPISQQSQNDKSDAHASTEAPENSTLPNISARISYPGNKKRQTIEPVRDRVQTRSSTNASKSGSTKRRRSVPNIRSNYDLRSGKSLPRWK